MKIGKLEIGRGYLTINLDRERRFHSCLSLGQEVMMLPVYECSLVVSDHSNLVVDYVDWVIGLRGVFWWRARLYKTLKKDDNLSPLEEGEGGKDLIPEGVYLSSTP